MRFLIRIAGKIISSYLLWNWVSYLIQKAGEDATETINNTNENKKLTAKKEAQFQEIQDELYRKLGTVGNLVHASVPISNDEVYD